AGPLRDGAGHARCRCRLRCTRFLLAELRPAPTRAYDPAVSITVERDEARRWLRVCARATLTVDELIAFLRTARAGEEFRMWPMLVDAEDATTDMSEEDIDR